MKILLIALHFSEYSYQLAKELSKNAHVSLVLSEPNYKAEMGEHHREEVKGLSMFLLPHRKSLRTVVKNVLELKKIEREFCPDIVHFQERAVEYQTLAMLAMRKRPTILTVHDPKPHMGRDSRLYSQMLRGRLQQTKLQRSLADGLITHGDVLADDLSRMLNYKKIVRAAPHGPLGIDQKKSTLSNTDRSVKFLFFGRMQEYKGLSIFVEAIDFLKSEGNDVQGIIAGRGEELSRLKDQISGKDHFVVKDEFLSAKAVTKVFDLSSAVVLPYIEGTQSGVAALAIGRGRPIIISNVGSFSEMVRDGRTGFLIEPGSVTSLVTAMRRFIDDKQLSSSMGWAALEFGAREVSWEIASEKTLSLYRKIIGAQDKILNASTQG